MRERLPVIALMALIAQIPFELRYTLLGLSNLQWTFLVLLLVTTPSLLQNRQHLLHDRLLQAAALFVGIQWIAALLSSEFQGNALKGAMRFAAGFVILAIARSLNPHKAVVRVWVISSAVAAIYALISYAGFGVTWLFRTENSILDKSSD